MRVLLVHPEFPLSFWTLRQSLKMAARKTLFPPLGLITVAALLPLEWEFRLADLNTRKLTEEDWNWADLVMITAMVVQREGLFSLIKEAKAREKTVVVGGPYSTSAPEQALEAGCDFLLRGEGENTIPLFLSALARGETQGVFQSVTKPDITASPIPRFDLLTIRDYAVMGIQTSRGCPFDCEFCDIVQLYGRTVRYKTPKQIVAELEAVYRTGWRAEVFISDDNFVGSSSHARAALQAIIPWMKEKGYPFSFWTQVSVNLGQDLELMDLMTEANFSHVFIGIESPDEDVLARNRKYHNIRNSLIESLRTINENGLSIMGSFIIGFDGERKGADDRIAALVEEAGVPLVMVNLLGVLRNTRLWERLKNEGRLIQHRTSSAGLWERLAFVPTRPEDEIMREYTNVWDRIYEPSTFLARAYRFYVTMRPTRRALAAQRGQALPPSKPLAKPPLRQELQHLLGLFYLVWWQGIRSPHRRQFWSQMMGIHKKNPSRLIAYLKTCALGENMFHYRNQILERARADE